MKTNKTKIEGDNNTSITDVNRSRIHVGDNPNQKDSAKKWTIIGVIVAVLGLIIAAIIGWEQILTFFN